MPQQTTVANLEPREVFRHFAAICRIPRGSHHEEAIGGHLLDFARSRGLEAVRDAAMNVIVRKPGRGGGEAAPAVILQAHMDMVWARSEDSAADPARDGVAAVVDGDRLRADGTTLGADNGIGMAYIMALLEAEDLPHPPLEAVFTVQEEIGMHGAAAVDVSPLCGTCFINLDSEEEGIFYAGCCGGVTVRAEVPAAKVAASSLPDAAERRCFDIAVSGLKGGHSGAEIDKQRGNANRLLMRVLDDLAARHDIGLCAVRGGHVDNAIPVRAEATVFVPERDLPAVERRLDELAEIFRRELRAADGAPDADGTAHPVRVAMLPAAEAEKVYTRDGARDLLTVGLLLPDGVAARDLDMPDLVETSSNFAIIQEGEESVVFTVSVRSSLASKKDFLCRQIDALVRKAGGKTTRDSAYPAWEFSRESRLRDIFQQAHATVYDGRRAVVTGIHAGLECGVFANHFRQLGRAVDMISLGPDVTGAHTPMESLSIASTGRVWRLIGEALRLLCR